MIRKSAWLATLVALACGTSARADFFSQLATVNEAAAGGSGVQMNVRQFNGSGNGGASYGNYFSSPGVPLGGADNPPVVGGDVRIVGADKLTFYNISLDGTPPVNFGPNQVVGVFALDATVTAITSGGINAQIVSGGLQFFPSAGTGSFNPAHPTTWGATDATGTMFVSTPLSQYTLAPPQNLLQGAPNSGGLAIPLPASLVNLTAANPTLPTPNAEVLFQKTRDTAGFITVTTSVLPPGFSLTGEGLYAEVTDTLLRGQNLQATLTGFTAADKDAFNTIFNNLVPGLSSPNFANWGTGTQQDYLPSDNPLANGDAAFSTGANAVPGILAVGMMAMVPEPASWVLCSVFLACLGAYRLRGYGRKVTLAC